MESVEKQLKELILSKYKSIREFSIIINMPYSTLDSIFKRGIGNASVSNIIKICQALNISADELSQDKIISVAKNVQSTPLSVAEYELVNNFRNLNNEGQSYIQQTIKLALKTYTKSNQRHTAFVAARGKGGQHIELTPEMEDELDRLESTPSNNEDVTDL